MSRVLRTMPWLYATVAFAVGAVTLVAGSIPDPAWRVAVVIVGTSAAMIGWFVHRLPFIFMFGLAVTTARLAGLHVGNNDDPLADLTIGHAVSDLAVGLAVGAMLAAVLWRRHGRFLARDAIDMIAVAIGASLVAWLVIANPLMNEHGVRAGLALATAAYLPASAVILTFSVDLMFTGLTRNTTMRFVVVAALLNVVAALGSSLRFVGRIAPEAAPVIPSIFVLAFLCMCAGVAHRDSPKTLEQLPDHVELRADTPARLAMMALSVLSPVALIASVAPTSSTDVLWRTLGTLAMVIAVVVRLVIAMRDHAHAQRALLQRVHRDELTGLMTRSRFVQHVSELLETTWRSEFQPTIVQLNLDRFKNINDSLGHYDANQVLIAVGKRLEALVVEFDGVVARSGGDDFVIVDRSTRSSADAMNRAAAIRDALAPPISVADSQVFVTASIGVAMAPRNRTLAAEELMRRTDIATHRAKADGRNRVALFDDSMQAHLTRRMDVEHALHGAIGRQEMRLYHQPIVDIVSGTVSGFEALMRWRRSDGTLVSPADFIPIAEETGIICELGAWALHDALRELRGWIDDGVVSPTATTSVNVSPRQIADPNFADVVRDALERSGVPPQLLWLEMTESMMLEEPERAQHTLRQIRAMGVRLALDDFGTGYSSLSLLQQFPIQRIKIDRAFVQGIAEHSNDRSLVRTVIAMAQSMGLDVVAEGVETVHQLQGLRELGCGKAQGYLISHPVPADAMRSTMVALDELASLSLFGPIIDDLPAIGSSGRVYEPAVPAIGGPIGGLTSRPLGQPSL